MSNYYRQCNRHTCSAMLYFYTYDSVSNQVLAGAEYTITNSCGCTKTVTSNAQGLSVICGLTPGTYTLTQTDAPFGYEINSAEHLIEVDRCCGVTVDGEPSEAFRVNNDPVIVPPPTINNVYEGDTTISGFGIPGASVSVTLPNGTVVPAAVQADGQWVIAVPLGAPPLTAGQTVSVTQTNDGITSLPAATVVLPLLLGIAGSTLRRT